MTVRVAACALFVAAALTSVAARAQTPPSNPLLAAAIAGAEKEGKLTVRWTNNIFGGPDGAKLAEAAINRIFGTHLAIEWSPGPAYGPMAAQLYQEMQAGLPASSDIYIATAVQLSPYLDKGLFKTVDWTQLMPSRITPAMVEADGRALRIATNLPGIVYNMKVAPWVAEVSTTADLLKPQYKGKFYTTPFLGGFDVLLAPDVWGVEKTTAYVKQLAPQLAGLVGCEATTRIASGEIPALAIDCGGGIPNRLDYRGKGILGNEVLTDMAQRRYNYLAVPSHAAHPNAATLFILYIMTVEGQSKMMWDIQGSDLDQFPDSHMKQEFDAVEARGGKPVDVSIAWWRSHPGLEAANAELAKLVREK
ncbi:MAG TPA: extracellular solute-binding protein [Stellaceae bacterium]|jgi:ABC-type Fe3+ transport system substrate-binding protein|nr:extracellular solute-binding protein [Stellaceae bacterium]